MRASIADATAISGLGWTSFTKASGRSVLDLAIEASVNAAEDAGLAIGDIDGMLTFQWNNDSIFPRDLAHALGIRNCNFQLFDQLGGAAACDMVATAAMAIYAGLCKNVLIFRAANGRSHRSTREGRAAVGVGQWTMPFGSVHAAATFGPYYVAYMERYGATTLDLAHVA